MTADSPLSKLTTVPGAVGSCPAGMNGEASKEKFLPASGLLLSGHLLTGWLAGANILVA